MATTAEKPLVFISYSHKDEVYKNQVLTHLGGLSQLSRLEPWHDDDIGAGERWYEEIGEKLNGCAVAILLISANFLNSKFCMQTEVPILLERRRRQKMMIMPILVENCFWKAVPWLNAIQMRPGKGDVIEALTKAKRNAAYTKIIEEIHEFLESDDARKAVILSTEQTETVRGDNNQVIQIQGSYNTIVLGSAPKADTTFPKPLAVDLTRLPTSGFDVVGRDDKLQFLNEAFDGDTLNVISLRAWGGVGKSTLVNKWCEYLAADNYRDARRIFAWSFYSQGTNDRVTSADLFINKALDFFGDNDSSVGSPWAKGERLAELVGKEKALLILDGMEPLQDTNQGIKDPALARLVECLAVENAGLCVITTREPVKEFADFPETTKEVDLEQLSKEAGRALLRIGGLRAANDLLERASEAFGNHALALSLLASYLKRFAGGNVSQALTVSDLPNVTVDAGKHPRRVMAAYAESLGEGQELDLLHVMGLFDRPADAECIASLRKAVIPDLTERLSALDQIGWLDLLARLRGFGLLAVASHHTPEELDAHPLVREHFGTCLRTERPLAWREGHNCLYEHLRNSVAEYPDTYGEIIPLYRAMRHGLLAERYEHVLNETFRRRIERGEEFFATRTLGVGSIALSSFAEFFEVLWFVPVSDISNSDKRFILNLAGWQLLNLGHFRQAMQTMHVELGVGMGINDNKYVGIAFDNLSHLYLYGGYINKSIELAKQGIKFCLKAKNMSAFYYNHNVLGEALHRAGKLDESLECFESIIEDRRDKYHQYWELLLDIGKLECVKKNIPKQIAGLISEKKPTLNVALLRLTYIRALLISEDIDEAAEHVEKVLEELRFSEKHFNLPHALILQARLNRLSKDFVSARSNLEQAFRIAQRSDMQIFICDIYVEYARLMLDETEVDHARNFLLKARQLVEATSYRIRESDIIEIDKQLSHHANPGR